MASPTVSNANIPISPPSAPAPELSSAGRELSASAKEIANSAREVQNAASNFSNATTAQKDHPSKGRESSATETLLRRLNTKMDLATSELSKIRAKTSKVATITANQAAPQNHISHIKQKDTVAEQQDRLKEKKVIFKLNKILDKLDTLILVKKRNKSTSNAAKDDKDTKDKKQGSLNAPSNILSDLATLEGPGGQRIIDSALGFAGNVASHFLMYKLFKGKKPIRASNISRGQRNLRQQRAIRPPNNAARHLRSAKNLKKAGVIGGSIAALATLPALLPKLGNTINKVGTSVKNIGKSVTRSIKNIGKNIFKGPGKGGLKTAGKTAGKAGLKTFGKRIPFLGAGLGALFAAQRAMAGDWTGAGLELASGATSLAHIIPGLGSGAGLAAGISIDAALAARDMKRESQANQPPGTPHAGGDDDDTVPVGLSQKPAQTLQTQPKQQKQTWWSSLFGTKVKNTGQESSSSPPPNQLGLIKTSGVMKNIEGIMLHHTGGGTVDSNIKTLQEKGFGYHYLVDKNGNIVQLAENNQRVSHAGKTEKINNRLGNHNSIGISMVAKNDSDVSQEQAQAAAGLASTLANNYNIPISNIVGHGEATSRKQSSEGMAALNLIRQGTDFSALSSNFTSAANDEDYTEDGGNPRTSNTGNSFFMDIEAKGLMFGGGGSTNPPASASISQTQSSPTNNSIVNAPNNTSITNNTVHDYGDIGNG